ncbi:MAG: DUF4258 domain-containing protein [Gammaproteobacteria bacterium]|nr:DUF4258 domain-containing protein [Gammaproteobacteria bacterium]
MNFEKHIEWSDEKNAKLIAERGIGFEDIYVAIQNGYLLGIVKGKEPKYAHQHIFVVFIDGYTYAVPFVEDENKIFLKTLYPSRELHKKYSHGGHDA